jgi:hypothetical protein
MTIGVKVSTVATDEQLSDKKNTAFEACCDDVL